MVSRVLGLTITVALIGCGDDGGGTDTDAMVECGSAADCSDPTPLCAAGRCVQCVADGQCGEGEVCVEDLCVPEVTTCSSSADCPAERPICQLGATEGVCVAPCSGDDECEGGACVEGSCVDCLAEPSAVLPTDACACDADCAGTGAVCEEGICAADCEETGCPEGLVCEGAPAECVTCPEDRRMEGETCDCDDQCGLGLECIGGFCADACDFDEMCGERECGHEVAIPSSCRDIDPACFGGGGGGLGDECSCNRDCAADAPFCTGFIAGGDRGFVCSDVCGAEDPCPEGFDCCGLGGARHCLSSDLATATGATCP